MVSGGTLYVSLHVPPVAPGSRSSLYFRSNGVPLTGFCPIHGVMYIHRAPFHVHSIVIAYLTFDGVGSGGLGSPGFGLGFPVAPGCFSVCTGAGATGATVQSAFIPVHVLGSHAVSIPISNEANTTMTIGLMIPLPRFPSTSIIPSAKREDNPTEAELPSRERVIASSNAFDYPHARAYPPVGTTIRGRHPGLQSLVTLAVPHPSPDRTDVTPPLLGCGDVRWWPWQGRLSQPWPELSWRERS